MAKRTPASSLISHTINTSKARQTSNGSLSNSSSSSTVYTTASIVAIDRASSSIVTINPVPKSQSSVCRTSTIVHTINSSKAWPPNISCTTASIVAIDSTCSRNVTLATKSQKSNAKYFVCVHARVCMSTRRSQDCTRAGATTSTTTIRIAPSTSARENMVGVILPVCAWHACGSLCCQSPSPSLWCAVANRETIPVKLNPHSCAPRHIKVPAESLFRIVGVPAHVSLQLWDQWLNEPLHWSEEDQLWLGGLIATTTLLKVRVLASSVARPALVTRVTSCCFFAQVEAAPRVHVALAAILSSENGLKALLAISVSLTRHS